jgi:hypothetical protein
LGKAVQVSAGHYRPNDDTAMLWRAYDARREWLGC